MNSPLPTELMFVNEPSIPSVAFTLRKCNEYGDVSAYDPECNDGTIPYTMNEKIALIVKLDNVYNTQAYVSFTTLVYGCDYDELTMSGTVNGQLDYMIYNPAQEWSNVVMVD